MNRENGERSEIGRAPIGRSETERMGSSLVTAEISRGQGTERMGSSLVTSSKQAACGARTRSGSPCRSLPVAGRNRCRMHGGKSTGPRTTEGRARVGAATRRRYVESALADGWVIVAPVVRDTVVRLLAALANSRNATATRLGIGRQGLRRVLDGLPSRPDEARHLFELIVRGSRFQP